MVRSNAYFKELIGEIRDKFGPPQSWQIIPKAVEMREHDFGKVCERLYA
jgi:hypothetical protein